MHHQEQLFFFCMLITLAHPAVFTPCSSQAEDAVSPSRNYFNCWWGCGWVPPRYLWRLAMVGEAPPGSQAQEHLSSLRVALGDKDRLWMSHSNLCPYRYQRELNLSRVLPVLSLLQACQKQLDAPRSSSVISAKGNILLWGNRLTGHF